jgi:hypothetical protein
LLERYVLGCIGFLPAETEAHLSQRFRQTYRKGGDWKAILRGVLHLDDDLDDRLRQMWDAHQQQAALRGTPSDPAKFALLALEDKCFAHLLKRTPPIVPRDPWAAPITVKAVGFWRDADGSFPQYPQPQMLVRPGWHAKELKSIIAYLRSGYNAHPDFAYCGWSTCRFEGCREGEFNGSAEFTDGEWGRPEGLAHYVEGHAVVLPGEFIDTMRANHWRPPPSPTPPHRTNFDHSFWINWATR